MASIRALEERCLELSAEGLIAGSVHVCAGQEAIPVGAVDALTETDRVGATYRGHGWALACGTPLTLLLAEICQRSGGVNGGRGGSPYLTASRYRLVGENAIVGAGLPIACGIALSSTARSEGSVVVASVGDGAMNQGATHEGLVFAAAFSLPLIVVCENNGWSEFSPASRQIAADASSLAGAFGIGTETVDGNDVVAVRAAALAAVGRIRDGNGPFLIECKTTRMRGHFEGDPQKYRDATDLEAAGRKDPIERAAEKLRKMGVSEADIAAAADAAARRIDEAVARGRAGTSPIPSEALADVYSRVAEARP